MLLEGGKFSKPLPIALAVARSEFGHISASKMYNPFGFLSTVLLIDAIGTFFSLKINYKYCPYVFN
jgi:hypothetical protein